MTNHIDEIGCSGKEESCRMKICHASIQSLETDKTISGVLVMDKHPVKAAGLNARTRRHLPDYDHGDDFLDKVKEELKNLSTFPRFQKVVEDLKVPSLEFVPDSVIENQYRNFITKLTKLIPDQVEKNKIDPGVVEKNQIDPRQIISKLISEKAHLYEDIQCILHVITYCHQIQL